ncbi:MAG: 23S rRNA (pseudouridine(1915)-N(3))-methyltransferase RlmH [Proteobacteria bacterium]|nr:23S rRNA (pseudouridine(1915)-N(3))-methyltransferase RlmH [Pseudomonadota bacterium]
MQCQIIAVGNKMPTWCELACDEYLSRLQHFMKCTLIELPTQKRHKSGNVAQYKEEEGRKMLQKITPQHEVIALEVTGQPWATPKVAKMLSGWQQQGKDLVFLIGGPDGLAPACLMRANQQWSLSALTFPHALARVVLLEQLYRGFSMLANHPYHRE